MNKKNELKVSSVSYEKSETINTQGNRASIEAQLKNGFIVKEENNGFWILTKPAKIMVTVENSAGEVERHNLKALVTSHYNKQRVSQKLCNQFEADIRAEKVHLYYMQGIGFVLS